MEKLQKASKVTMTEIEESANSVQNVYGILRNCK